MKVIKGRQPQLCTDIDQYFLDEIADLRIKHGGTKRNIVERLLASGIDQYKKGNVAL